MPALRVPLRFDGILYPMPVVEVRVDGSPRPLPFLLDTGFSGTVLIFPETAQRLRLAPAGPETVYRTGNTQGKVGTRRAQVRSLLLGGVVPLPLTTVEVGGDDTISSAFGVPLAGVVGSGVLTQFRSARLDFARGELGLSGEGAKALAPQGAAAAVPLRQAGVPSVTVKLPDGSQARTLIDTGAATTVLGGPTSSRLFTAFASAPLPSSWVGDAAGTYASAGEVRLPWVQLGALREPAVFALAATTNASIAGVDGVLGMDLLSRFALTLDYGAEKLWLERSADYERFRRGMGATGIAPMRGRDGWYVGFVLPGSPAEQAGLRYGDQLVTVGGQPMDTLPGQAALHTLEGRELTSVRLEARRPGADGRPRLLDMTLRRTARTGIVRIFLPNHGLLLLGKPRGTLYVAAAGDFSPSGDGQEWETGPAAALVGSEIESVNGTPVVYLTRRDWARAVGQDLRLKVRGRAEVVLPARKAA